MCAEVVYTTMMLQQPHMKVIGGTQMMKPGLLQLEQLRWILKAPWSVDKRRLSSQRTLIVTILNDGLVFRVYFHPKDQNSQAQRLVLELDLVLLRSFEQL